jgi:hypothetical protein
MLKLHAVIIDKDIPLAKAKKTASSIIKKETGFYRKTEDSIRFRNIPKTKFKEDSFKSKKINESVTLVFGKLK